MTSSVVTGDYFLEDLVFSQNCKLKAIAGFGILGKQAWLLGE